MRARRPPGMSNHLPVFTSSQKPLDLYISGSSSLFRRLLGWPGIGLTSDLHDPGTYDQCHVPFAIWKTSRSLMLLLVQWDLPVSHELEAKH